MAGYLITLKDEESLVRCIKTGTYSTILNVPNNKWKQYHEGTFADYLGMKDGDLVFFFIKRKIYGCGKIINVGDDCKYLNYISADDPRADSEKLYAHDHLLQYGSSMNRCFCSFVPYPYFFKDGIDMDEVLQNRSCPFHSLRTLWKLSFIKLDDNESDTLFEIVVKHNEDNIHSGASTFRFDNVFHALLKEKNLSKYTMTSKTIVSACVSGDRVKHEMAIEATLCEKLVDTGIQPFGRWDYISHQVCASPFKPVDYMDKMDIFGYRYIEGYKVKSKYLIIELKKDEATKDVVEQILKYVDWVADEYANGDYSMIEAYIVASSFDDSIKSLVRQYAVRNFNKGFRPTRFCTWTDLKLVNYKVVNDDLTFSTVDCSI